MAVVFGLTGGEYTADAFPGLARVAVAAFVTVLAVAVFGDLLTRPGLRDAHAGIALVAFAVAVFLAAVFFGIGTTSTVPF